MLAFLHRNAMQFAGLLAAVDNTVLLFLKVTPAQAIGIGGLAPALGIFLTGVTITATNGKT